MKNAILKTKLHSEIENQFRRENAFLSSETQFWMTNRVLKFTQWNRFYQSVLNIRCILTTVNKSWIYIVQVYY